MISICKLVKYGRMLGYRIQPAKGKGKYRIVNEGVFTKKQLIRIVVHMEEEKIDEWRSV